MADLTTAFQEAAKLQGVMNSLKGQAKAKAMAPFTTALQGAANQYNTAQTDEQRQNARALASLTRSNILRGGYSPTDIDSKYWGSDPSRGFETTEGFQAPVTGYEGLPRTDAISSYRQGLQDLLEQKKWEMSPESDPRYKGLYLQNLERQAIGGGGSGGGGGSSSGGGSGGALSDAYAFINGVKAKGGTYDTAMDYYYSNREVFESEGVSESEFKNMAKYAFPDGYEPPTTTTPTADNRTFTAPIGGNAVLNKALGWR